jgi:hypothetical protein
MMLQKVETAALRMVEEKYARKFLEYKDVVEVEYSANYLESDSLVKVLRGPDGTNFVHYVIEPKRLSVNEYEKKYYTVLKVNGNVTTTEGRQVYQFDKTVNLEWGGGDGLRATCPSTSGRVHPRPGITSCRSSSRTGVKEFTSGADAPASRRRASLMTAPILAFNVGPADTANLKIRPFRLAAATLLPAGPGVLPKDTLSVAFQLLDRGRTRSKAR